MAQRSTDLLHRIGVALQNYDLQVSRQLPLAETLLGELPSLRVGLLANSWFRD